MKKRVLIALVVVLALAATASLVWANIGGLVSYWPFEGTPNDVVNGNHGTIVGGAAYVPGKFGQALSLDGTDDHVSVGDSANLNFGTGDFTIGAWIKLTTTDHSGQYYGIFDKGQVTPTTEGRYSLFITPWNTLRLHIGAPGSGLFYRDSTLTITDTNWHYIAVSVDRDGNAIFAVDSTTETADVSASSSYNTSSTTGATIGVRVDVAKWWFDGHIDEVGIWNRALNADEVAALSVGVGSVGWLPPLVLEEWTLNENATLPIKFQLYGAYGNLLCTPLNATLDVTTFGLQELRFDDDGCYYIANFRPGASATGLTATVCVDSVEVGVSREFEIVEAGTPNGRGRSK